MIRESSLSTRICPVFDASAHKYNGVVLNDYPETRPNLVPILAVILIRFRRWCFTFTTDISRAFLQIAVTESDQDVHLILWNDWSIIRVMKFLSFPFGNRCIPFFC